MVEILRERIISEEAWIGAEMQQTDSWIWRLTEEEKAEIDSALLNVKEAGATIPFDADVFPLPEFKPRLCAMIDSVLRGTGVALVHGISRDHYSDEDCQLLYWGLGMHIGHPVSQNARGHLLGHVTDEGRDLGDPDARGYQTRNRLDFHCDQLPTDIIGLFCMRGAKSGGASYLVSAPTVHNVLLNERPDLIGPLYEMFHVDWRGDHPDGGQPWYDMPMFSVADGKLSARFTNRAFIDSTVRYGDHLAPTDAQREALDVVQEIANRPELRLEMDFQEGDIQLINNLTVMHARQAYEDYDDPRLKRHLLRMWIGLPDGQRRPLSPLLDERYEYVRRGGIPKQAAA
ncbi:MAG: TauD/TfdA family dioxygenase [Rhodospirillales bacterium]|nr:TauD/TfdA family dioxygenase [Rhodospirillales bacterium]